MDGGVMLAVARAELAPQTLEALATLGFEEVVRVFGERQQFAPRRLYRVHLGRLCRGDVGAHALALGEAFDELRQIFEQARAALESLRRFSESLCDSRERLFERSPSGQRRVHSRRRATEALAHIALGLPSARRQATVRQRVELPLKSAGAPRAEPRAERRAQLLARATRDGRDEDALARQQTRPLDRLLRQRRSLVARPRVRARSSDFPGGWLRTHSADIVDDRIADIITDDRIADEAREDFGGAAGRVLARLAVGQQKRRAHLARRHVAPVEREYEEALQNQSRLIALHDRKLTYRALGQVVVSGEGAAQLRGPAQSVFSRVEDLV